MNIEDVRKIVNDIEEKGAVDPEVAHETEDALYRDILRHIAWGSLKGDEAREVAVEALKTKQLDFPRWMS